MKRTLHALCILLLGTGLGAQILDPVDWSFSVQPAGNDQYDLIFTATLDEGWNIYSQYLESEDGPIPTSFHFEDGPHFRLVGKTEEWDKNRKEGHDPIFDMNVVKYYKKAVFTQRVEVLDPSKPITGWLEYMTCDDERCLPPTEEDFSFTIPASEPAATPAQTSSLKPLTPPTDLALTPSEDSGGSSSGLLDPVKWSVRVEKLSDNRFALHFTATLEPGWYIYAQDIAEGGPIPTRFHLDEGQPAQFKGLAREEGAHKKEGFDPIFEMEVVKYAQAVTFVQEVETTDPAQPITGWLEYMTCDDERCLPPMEKTFRAELAALKAAFTEPGAAPAESAGAVPVAAFRADIDTEPLTQCGEIETVDIEKKSLWSIFILGLLGGLVALLTPCVFPMIPLTVSYFTKGSENRRKGTVNAFLYGFFILLVYLVLSLPFHLMDSINPDILNDISTNVFLNVLFFVIFLVFAFSFFGYYELTLPEKWTNKASAAEGIGGVLGIFFMALTLALVSFSCTGPILGSLLAGALTATGGATQLTAGMAGFGLALALPFGLFAAFPGWLNSLPKSGGWLNTVKVVLGFLELALALKFLSNADLVKHWGLLKIEPFLVLWMLIFLGMGLYLFGKIRFPHDSPVGKLSWGRIGLGLASFAFAVYLASGLLYDERAGSLRPLKLLSGLAPPACYSWLYPCDCPQNLNCFHDFEEGMAYARQVNKPVMIDFTGHACVNCRKMEEHVWPEKQVYDLLKDDFVLISLYVDEKIELPEDEQVVVKKADGGTRKLRTVGHKWSHFQSVHFNANTQPLYVLMSPEGKVLNPPVGYTPDPDEFAAFLRCGLEAWKQSKALSSK